MEWQRKDFSSTDPLTVEDMNKLNDGIVENQSKIHVLEETKAPNDHASANTSYGESSISKYGHYKFGTDPCFLKVTGGDLSGPVSIKTDNQKTALVLSSQTDNALKVAAGNIEVSEGAISAVNGIYDGSMSYENRVYSPSNLPPNPLDDWRKVTFCWTREISLNYNIAATAEITCHKSFINWNFDDKALAQVGLDGLRAVLISIDTLALFLKSLGYGGKNTFYLGAKQQRSLPMSGFSKFLTNSNSIRPSDIIGGLYVNRDLNTITYLASEYTVEDLKQADIYATVRRIL